MLFLSILKSKKKTLLALKKAGRMFLNVLPQFLVIVLIVSPFLAILEQETIQSIIGAKTGTLGVVVSSLLGSAVIVPAIIAFPIASELLQNGAGLMQVTVFISTLTMVGFVTLPLEVRYLGKKTAVMRNALAFLFSLIGAYVVSVVLT